MSAKKRTIAVPRVAPAGTHIVKLPCLQILSGTHAGLVIPLNSSHTIIGCESDCQIVIDEPGVSRHHARIDQHDGCFRLFDLESTNGVYVGEEAIQERVLGNGDLLYFGAVMARFDHHSVAELDVARRLFEGATRDSLTGALNRGSFFEWLQQELHMAGRRDGTFTLAMLDIDHFKRVNDIHGHPAGDAVLRQVADHLRASLRIEDVLGRYGGEEFAMLLRNAPLAQAMEVAERVRRRIAEASFNCSGPEGERELRVTISVGLATWSPLLTQEALLAQADEALYTAKQSGRNRVVAAAT